MSNPFRRIKQLVKRHNFSAEEAVQTLLATVLLECCHECSDKMHSEAFLEAVNHMASEMRRCKELAGRHAA